MNAMTSYCRDCDETDCICCIDCGPVHDCPECKGARAQDHADDMFDREWRGGCE